MSGAEASAVAAQGPDGGSTVATAAPRGGGRPATPRRPAPISTRFFRSELALIAGRRRNQAGLLALAAVPIILAIAVKLTASDGPRGGGLVAQVTTNGLFVPLAALTFEVTMFLPLAIAMVSGDAIAGEANQGTLRALLTVPVTRTRLLVVKYASLLVASFWAVLAVVLPGVIIGLALFGFGPMVTFSGSQLGGGEAVWRLVIAALYVTAAMAALAAVGLFFSTLTEQPIAVTVAVMIFVIASWILQGIEQVSWLHPWLLVNYATSFIDVLREPIAWEQMQRGLAVFAAYAAVFWLAAWARFAGKDITS